LGAALELLEHTITVLEVEYRVSLEAALELVDLEADRLVTVLEVEYRVSLEAALELPVLEVCERVSLRAALIWFTLRLTLGYLPLRMNQ
jgi:hypothetical protein